ncbi:MAG: hypothetical protein NTU88_12265 [Armatimonadetes bacterium]|nr:hypothetical protein [Armatimonadota bacterium]
MNATMWISPEHREDDVALPLSLDDKIEIFEARVRGWQLDVADIGARAPFSDGKSTTAAYS